MVRNVGFNITWILGLLAGIAFAVTYMPASSGFTDFAFSGGWQLFLSLLLGIIIAAIGVGIIILASFLIWRPDK